MDTKRLMELAGLPANENDTLYEQLTEVVQIPADVSIEELTKRLEHCKRALSLCAKLEPADRKKWLSATFVNLNKVRGALKVMLSKMDTAPSPIQTQSTPTAAPVQPTVPGPIPVQ